MSADGQPITNPRPVSSTLIDNVDVAVEAYLGATTVTVGELNALSAERVIALNATLNSSVELRVNGIAIARGELVAVGDHFGVRVTAVSA